MPHRVLGFDYFTFYYVKLYESLIIFVMDKK